MSCSRYQQWIIDSIYGEISARNAKRLARHLSTCPDCRAEMESLRLTHQMIRESHQPEIPPEAIRHTILQQAQSFVPQKTRSRWLRPLPASLAAAALVVAITGVYILHFQPASMLYSSRTKEYGLSQAVKQEAAEMDKQDGLLEKGDQSIAEEKSAPAPKPGGEGGASQPMDSDAMPEVAPSDETAPSMLYTQGDTTMQNRLAPEPIDQSMAPPASLSETRKSKSIAVREIPASEKETTGVSRNELPQEHSPITRMFEEPGPEMLSVQSRIIAQVAPHQTAPEIIHQTEPVYPEEARRQRIQGTVESQIVVDESGHVQELKISSSTNAIFNNAVTEALVKWTFRASRINGKASSCEMTVITEFSVKQ